VLSWSLIVSGGWQQPAAGALSVMLSVTVVCCVIVCRLLQFERSVASLPELMLGGSCVSVTSCSIGSDSASPLSRGVCVCVCCCIP